MTGTSQHAAMVRGQRARKDQTRERIFAALQTIEEELDKHGLYPNNNGKINLVEVQRRAGVGSTTLRNSHHHEVRKVVQDWLTQLKERGKPTSKPATQAVAQGKIAWYENQLKLLSADALTWRIQREALIKENQELRDQIVTFSAEQGKIVGIRGMSGKRD